MSVILGGVSGKDDDVIGGSRYVEPRYPFSWGYFAAIMIGLLVTVAVICSIATLLPKQEAKFSELMVISNAA